MTLLGAQGDKSQTAGDQNPPIVFAAPWTQQLFLLLRDPKQTQHRPWIEPITPLGQ